MNMAAPRRLLPLTVLSVIFLLCAPGWALAAGPGFKARTAQAQAETNGDESQNAHPAVRAEPESDNAATVEEMNASVDSVSDRTRHEKQLNFELKQLELMNERQQKLIQEMQLKLKHFKSQQYQTDTADVAAQSKMAIEKEADRQRESQRSLDDFLQEQHAVFTRRLTIEPAITYTGSDRKQISLSGFLAVDAIFLGRLDVDEVDNRVVTFDITSRYTLTDAIQLYLRVPYVYRETEFASAGVNFSSASASDVELDESALGDIAFGAYFRAKEETDRLPDIVINLGARAPTGKDPFAIKVITPDPNNTNLRVPERLATGSGVWAASLGVSMVKTLDPAIVFGGLEYTYQFEEELSDISTTPGSKTRGEVRLGDSIQMNLGTAFALNRIMSLSFSFSNQLLDDTRIRIGRDWVYIPGSSANIATFNIGTTFNIAENRSIAVNLASGLTREASDFTLSLRMPFVI